MTIQNRLAEEIRSARHCVLSTHMHPDGDALGSLLALGSALKRSGIPCTILSPGDVPQNLRFLPLLDQMREDMPEAPDVVIALDCAEAARLSPEPELIESARLSLCVDHHRSNPGFCDLNWIDPDRGSTAEMVYELLGTLGMEPDTDESSWLYTGLVTDTGRFLYSGTSPGSHRMAADLLERGIARDEIHQHIFQATPYADFSLYRETIARAEFYKNRALALSWVTLEDFQRTGAAPDQTDPALHTLRDIDEIEMSCLLKEHAKEEFKISLRSKQTIDVSAIAAELGGGGHLRAAGCTVHGTLSEVKSRLMDAVEAHWKDPA